ncbi:hypothetical protein KCP75_06635 [Salmonella enterica subsp. enterica]|nr:hypothetical protein KCP75_06635 [Salmonella enterica subsp. enterica]
MVSRRCCGKDRPWFVGRSRSVCRGRLVVEGARRGLSVCSGRVYKLTLTTTTPVCGALPPTGCASGRQAIPAVNLERRRLPPSACWKKRAIAYWSVNKTGSSKLARRLSPPRTAGGSTRRGLWREENRR